MNEFRGLLTNFEGSDGSEKQTSTSTSPKLNIKAEEFEKDND